MNGRTIKNNVELNIIYANQEKMFNKVDRNILWKNL